MRRPTITESETHVVLFTAGFLGRGFDSRRLHQFIFEFIMTTLGWRSRLEELKRHSPATLELLEDLVTEAELLGTLERIERWLKGLEGNWCYRGHADESWHLVSSLDRERKPATVAVGDRVHTAFPAFNATARQRKLLAEFRQSDSRQTTNDDIDTLAIMQHYGVPTTSLDFSRSPYVALWFALKDFRSEKHNDGSPKGSALWAVSLDWLEEANQTMISDGCRDVIVVEPVTRPSPRMTAQRGALLSNRGRLTFSEALLRMLLKSPVAAEKQVVSKVIVQRGWRRELLKELEKIGIYRTSMLRPDGAVKDRTELVVNPLRDRARRQRERFRRSLGKRMKSRGSRE